MRDVYVLFILLFAFGLYKVMLYLCICMFTEKKNGVVIPTAGLVVLIASTPTLLTKYTLLRVSAPQTHSSVIVILHLEMHKPPF